ARTCALTDFAPLCDVLVASPATPDARWATVRKPSNALRACSTLRSAKSRNSFGISNGELDIFFPFGSDSESAPAVWAPYSSFLLQCNIFCVAPKNFNLAPNHRRRRRGEIATTALSFR